ncbi:MAG: hypothetical protein WCT99_04800 [Bacteroidota bacterium]|jgi:hypothetical protein
MKKIIFLLSIAAGILSAQNPDGKNVSLHLTPLWMWGNADFHRQTRVWYPPTQASDAQTVLSNNYGVADYPLAFGFQTEIKVPAASFLTLSLNYSYNQNFQEDNKNYAQGNYFSEYYSLNGKYQTVSFTLSLYNLFSVYQGE